MTEIQQVALPSGHVVYVRVDAASGLTAGGMVKKLHKLTETIQGVAQSVHQELMGLSAFKPHSTTVEFGLEIGIEAGEVVSVLAKGSAKAEVRVTLTWDLNDNEAELPQAPPHG